MFFFFVWSPFFLYLRGMKGIIKPNPTSQSLSDNQLRFTESFSEWFYRNQTSPISKRLDGAINRTRMGKYVAQSKGVAYIYGSDDIVLRLMPYGKRSFELCSIESKDVGRGHGSKAMHAINSLSILTGTTIFLRPVAFTRKSCVDQLRVFYNNHGFRRCPDSLYWSNINLLK